jgi:cytochrome oxidase Cu insertion factor (SCO1/SenC/PrrC family)
MSSSTSSVSPAAVTDVPTAEERRRRGRVKAFGIFLVCLAPFVAAWITYYFWMPSARMNYGDLVTPPHALPAVLGTREDGRPLTRGDLRGKWAMVQVDGGDCRAACSRKLYNMRQVRLAQGKNMDRIERVWLVADDAPLAADDPELYKGMLVARVRDAAALDLPAEADLRDHVYLVDPLGQVMLRFPRDADPTRMRKDIARLLRASQIG